MAKLIIRATIAGLAVGLLVGAGLAQAQAQKITGEVIRLDRKSTV